MLKKISQGNPMPNPPIEKSPFMDVCARVWRWIGWKFQARPATVIGVVVGAIIFASACTYILVEQSNTEQAVKSIQTAFCNGRNPAPEKCRDLLDAILDNATSEQKVRLQEIVNE